MVVRILHFCATPQVGDFVGVSPSNEPFKHELRQKGFQALLIFLA